MNSLHIWNQSIEYTVNSPNIVGHDDFLEPMLILIMWINVGHINFQPQGVHLKLRSGIHVSAF